jgi:hypothetical protein
VWEIDHGNVIDASYRVSYHDRKGAPVGGDWGKALDKKPLLLMKREAARSGFAECLGRRSVRVKQ